MSKKVNQTLTGAMAAMMATGVVATPVMAATTDADALYKAAFTAVRKAESDKSQASVNEARAAIKALKDTGAAWAIGQFSGMVDRVQDPILRNILNGIKTAEKTPTQANINAARKTIPAELTQNWKNSYSAAIDKIQQGLQVKALEALKKAETDKTKVAIDAAKEIVADILTADSASMVAWAKTIDAKIDAIFTLKVTNFSITSTGVTVEFDPTTEILKDVTVTVIDNNGNEVAVQKVDRILAGKSKQVFSFERVLSKAVQGVWTVNGVAIDMTEVSLVKGLTGATSATNAGTSLINLQEKGYINGLLGEYKSIVGSTEKIFVFDQIDGKNTPVPTDDVYVNEYYHNAIKKEIAKNTVTTAKQIQAIIDKVNEDLGVSVDEKVRVELIKKSATSGNATQFVNALDAENMERVNSDWAVAGNTNVINYTYDNYATEIANANTLKDIQKAIDASNLTNVGNKLAAIKSTNNWVNADKVSEVSELANAYLTAEQKITPDNKILAKQYYVNTVKEQLALINIIEADNTSTLLRTLKALSTVSEDFDYDKNGYDENINAYKTKLDGIITAKKTAGNLYTLTTTDIADAIYHNINGVNTAQITNAVNNVVNAFVTPTADGKYTTDEKKVITEALDKLVALTAKEVNDVNVTTGKVTKINKFDKAIVKLDLEEYKDVAGTTVDTLYDSFKGVNDIEAGTTVENAVKAVKNSTTADALYKALSNELLKVTNLVEANKAEYNRDLAVFTTAASKVDANDAVKAIQKVVTSVNAKTEMLKATTVDAMYQGLTKLAISEGNAYVINMTADNRRDVAEEILNYKNSVYTGTVNLSTIEDALDATIVEGTTPDKDKPTGTISIAQAKVEEKIKTVNAQIEFKDSKFTITSRSALIDALNEITGIDKLTLDGKVEAFIAKSQVKDSTTGLVTGKVTYGTYTQVRNALK